MHEADVLVIGSTKAAYCACDGIRLQGARVTSWILPPAADIGHAHALTAAEAARPQWAPAIRSVHAVISAWVDTDIAEAVMPYITPHLGTGGITWHQLGAGTAPEHPGLELHCIPAHPRAVHHDLAFSPRLPLLRVPGLNTTPLHRADPTGDPATRWLARVPVTPEPGAPQGTPPSAKAALL
jgi:hypothetical protein